MGPRGADRQARLMRRQVIIYKYATRHDAQMAPSAAGLRSARCLRRRIVARAGSQRLQLPLCRFQDAALCYLLAAAVAAAAIEIAAAQKNADEAATIATTEGALRGTTRRVLSSAVDTYQGIPYAAPPVGALRLSRPQAPHVWSGVRNATRFGPVCPQVSGGLFANGIGGRLVGEEDCLYLNVYAPRSNGSNDDGGGGSARAIMVFFHGGGFVSGSSAEYDPTVLALSGDVIVVTANYRIGMLGFLRVGDLNPCSRDGGRRLGEANFGLWDQHAAIEWVRRNAAAFGGDARRITVFGESAGARSVSLLALSPVANGLFQRVIAQSGSGSAARTLYRNTALTTAGATARLNLTAAIGGGSGSGTEGCLAGGEAQQAAALAALRSLDLSTLVLAGSDPSPDWSPVIDGEFLPDDVERLWLLDGFRRLQYLCGYNSQEGLLFIESATARAVSDFNWGSLDGGINQTVLDAVIKSQLAQLVPDSAGGLKTEALRRAAAEVYYGTATSGGNGQIDDRERLFIATDFVGDNYFAAPLTDLAYQRSAEGREANATYVYYLDRKRLVNSAGSGVPKWLRTGALHTDDLPLVFGGAALYALNTGQNVTSTVKLTFPFAFWIGDDTEFKLAMKVMTYWTNFAKTGSPNTPEGVEVVWPVYTANEPQLMLFHYNGSRVLNGLPNKRRLDFWHTMVFSEFRSLRNMSTASIEASTTSALGGIGWRVNSTPSLVAIFSLLMIVTTF